MNDQDILRQNCKLAKALNEDWNYKKMSEVIDISYNGFMNWLHNAYDLSTNKYNQLKYIISNLLD